MVGENRLVLLCSATVDGDVDVIDDVVDENYDYFNCHQEYQNGL